MRSAFWLNLAVKLSLVLLLAFGAFSGLERFAGKAFGFYHQRLCTEPGKARLGLVKSVEDLRLLDVVLDGE